MSTNSAAEIIRVRKQEILDRWIGRVLNQIPDARKRTLPIIRNSVPDLLDALADALASDDNRDIVYESDRHGQERANYTEYTVDQIIREYRLLKETIFAVTDEEEGRLEARERDGIMYAIDQAVEQASSVFSRIHIEKNQQAIEKAEELINELEERDDLRDQFIATLSHDIRTPLGNTKQLVELLEKRLASPADSFISKALQGIKLSAEQGNNLINTLMDVNLIQSGNPIPLQKVESDLLQEVKNSLQGLKPATRNLIKIESSQEQIVGYWDAPTLSRAINNLISNAVKYGSQGGVVTLSFNQTEQKTVVQVHNLGNPIPLEKLDKLFDLYYRTEDINAQGWGLGLTLVKGIIEMHNGSVEVDSDANRGTTFSLYIPSTSNSAT
ncbi:sensor histidine kinase [Tunicatimonas pelagia]|uniref:sensor histidine kinase n=1 Tax=Tunicatimonas pelagia TaxID=931531 RepID=UPI002664F682|nr:HAMP domain-containing sensor histidine kinase [Tunicatimonas pelagia]WKN44653.1 HAMP domain-containing sensor histidine kinase [Tunicatimonas pelagia]